MNSENFDQLFQSLETGVTSIAEDSLQDYLSQAKKDGQDALNSMKANLQRWTAEVASGDMTAEDLEFLLQEEAALDEMKTLKQAGLAEVRIDKFKTGLISMILSTLTSFSKP